MPKNRRKKKGGKSMDESFSGEWYYPPGSAIIFTCGQYSPCLTDIAKLPQKELRAVRIVADTVSRPGSREVEPWLERMLDHEIGASARKDILDCLKGKNGSKPGPEFYERFIAKVVKHWRDRVKG